MLNTREQAKKLVESYENAWDYPHSLIFNNQYSATLAHAPDIARAYLTECDVHEQTRKRLEDALTVLEWYAMEYEDTGYRARDFLARMAKGASE